MHFPLATARAIIQRQSSPNDVDLEKFVNGMNPDTLCRQDMAGGANRSIMKPNAVNLLIQP